MNVNTYILSRSLESDETISANIGHHYISLNPSGQVEVIDSDGQIVPSVSVVPITTGATISSGVYLVDASGNNLTLNLSAASITSTITIKKIDSSVNSITVDANASETIDGALTATLTQQYESITLVSDGSNWYIT